MKTFVNVSVTIQKHDRGGKADGNIVFEPNPIHEEGYEDSVMWRDSTGAQGYIGAADLLRAAQVLAAAIGLREVVADE